MAERGRNNETYPHITINARQRPSVDGTRHRVIDIAADHASLGLSPKEIVAQYPDLTLAQVHAALAYYYDHQAAMDATLLADQREAAKLRKQHTPHPKLVAARMHRAE